MTRRTLALALLAVALFTPSAQARLGESLSECAARYGRYIGPVDEAGRIHLFTKDGINTKIHLSADQTVCEALLFTAAEKGGLSLRIAEALIAANAAGQTWTSLLGDSGKTWTRGDKQAHGYFDGRRLIIAAQSHLDGAGGADISRVAGF